MRNSVDEDIVGREIEGPVPLFVLVDLVDDNGQTGGGNNHPWTS